MTSHGLAAELNQLLATENRSLARHLDEAPPYLDARTFPIWKRMQPLAEASRAHAAELSRLIDELDLPPEPGHFSPVVANYHYVGLDFMLPKLIEEKRGQLGCYQRAVEHARSNDDLRESLAKLAEETEGQLAELESLLTAVAS